MDSKYEWHRNFVFIYDQCYLKKLKISPKLIHQKQYIESLEKKYILFPELQKGSINKSLGIAYYEISNYEKARYYVGEYLKGASGAGLKKEMLEKLNILQNATFYANNKNKEARKESIERKEYLFADDTDITIEQVLEFYNKRDFNALLKTADSRNYNFEELRRRKKSSRLFSLCINLSVKLLRKADFAETDKIYSLLEVKYLNNSISYELALISRIIRDKELLEKIRNKNIEWFNSTGYAQDLYQFVINDIRYFFNQETSFIPSETEFWESIKNLEYAKAIDIAINILDQNNIHLNTQSSVLKEINLPKANISIEKLSKNIISEVVNLYRNKLFEYDSAINLQNILIDKSVTYDEEISNIMLLLEIYHEKVFYYYWNSIKYWQIYFDKIKHLMVRITDIIKDPSKLLYFVSYHTFNWLEYIEDFCGIRKICIEALKYSPDNKFYFERALSSALEKIEKNEKNVEKEEITVKDYFSCKEEEFVNLIIFKMDSLITGKLNSSSDPYLLA